jgi:putative ABC transport system permease protein
MGNFELRFTGRATDVTARMKDVARNLDSRLATDFFMLAADMNDVVQRERLTVKFVTFFAVLTLILVAIGIYGVMSYVTAQRTHEIGIRMALGADQGSVLRMVMGKTSGMTLIGIAAGSLFAFGVARTIRGILYGVSPADPITFTIVAGIIFSTALLAAYLPAQRASKIDPAMALRSE